MAKKSLAERMQKDAKLRARVLANPGLRSKIDSSLLPEKYQRARAANIYRKRYASDPSMVTEQKTQADLDREAKAAADVRYGQDERDMQDSINASPQQQANIQVASDEYQKRNDEIAKRLGDVHSQVQGVVGVAKAEDIKRDDSLRAELEAEQAKDSALRGAPIDSSVSAAAVKASQGRQGALDTFGVQQAIQQSSAQDVLGKRALAAKTEFGEYGRQEQNRLRDTIRKRGLLQREKGDYQTKYQADARQSERDYKNQRSAIALNQTEAQQDADAKEAQQQLDALEFNADQSYKNSQLALGAGRLSESERAARAREQIAASKGVGGTSPAARERKKQQAIAYRDKISGAAADIKTILDTAKKKGTDLSTSQIRLLLRKQYESDSVVNAAMDLHFRGGLSPKNREALTEQGYGVPQEWKSKYKPLKSKKVRKKTTEDRVTDVADKAW